MSIVSIMQNIFEYLLQYPLVAIFTAFVAIICLYGVFLAIALKFLGEWQWLFLPFIALLPFIADEILLKFEWATPLDSLFIAIFLRYIILIIVGIFSLQACSGFGIYWLMRKYRSQTGFVSFYASIFFLNAIIQIGYVLAILFKSAKGIHFFKGSMLILGVYTLVVMLSGVNVMRLRLKNMQQEEV